jgi:hypothetical protein
MRRKAMVLTLALTGSVLVSAPASAAAKDWRNVSSAALKTAGTLDHLDVVSAKSAFAIGTEQARVKLLRWNGKAWQRQKSSWNFLPTGIAAAGPKKAWAIGFTTTGSSAALYWNGKAWKKVAYPSPPLAGVLPALPMQIAASKDGAAFSIAGLNAANGGPTSLMRWNGARWVKASIPMPANTSLSAISVRAKNDVWVGGTVPNVVAHALPVTWHWNGKSWKQIPIPGDWGLAGTTQNAMADLLAVSATSVYALRSQNAGALLHWNGKTWTEIPTPLGIAPYRLAGNESGGVWVLPAPHGLRSSEYFHWGRTWSSFSGPRRSGTTSLKDIDWIPGTRRVVGVGNTARKGGQFPIIEIFK